MTTSQRRAPRLPPRWFVRSAWQVHRAIFRLSRGRVGLWRPSQKRWGALRLTVTGRRSGQPRSVILGYLEDGPDLVTVAMNGWAEGEPAWWLNLQAAPLATVELRGRTQQVRAHAATGAERDRLWARWRQQDDRLDGFAALRSTQTAVVVLEPVTAGASAGRRRGG